MKQRTMVFAAVLAMAEPHPVGRALRQNRDSATEAAS
ncbi:hypothetical protein MED193_04661 [Roseobacter sp. MED193]|nr:hypothetical protein MED193_04661 [Roseobacter sp. MED193]